MNRSPTSGLDLAVTHLNAPVGRVLTRDELIAALQAGRLAAIPRQQAAALASYLFTELEPALIARCIREAHSDLRRANDLYDDTLRADAPRSSRWESSVRHFL